MPHKMNIPRVSDSKARIKPVNRGHKRVWRSPFTIALMVIAVVLTGAGIFYYHVYVAPFRQIVLTVDNQVIRMDYFLKRIRMAGNDPTLTLQQLTYEQIVKIMAPQYGIAVSPSDIDEELRKEAAGSATDVMTDVGFQEWYTNRIKAAELSDSEYREIVRTNLLAIRFLEYLAEDIPTTAEQIHLYTIVTATSEDAIDAKSRITKGENFATIAGEISLDSQTKSKGGELGWIPLGVTPYDDVIFHLAAGQVSDPVAIDPSSPSTSQYAIFMVSEKDPLRVIDANPLEVLRSRAFYDLILQQIPQHVKYSYTPEDNEWVTEQLTKDPKK
jgi:parvulin-like peptidyl-prolyl isomerase